MIELRQLGTTFVQQSKFDLLNDPEALAHYLRDIFLGYRMLNTDATRDAGPPRKVG